MNQFIGWVIFLAAIMAFIRISFRQMNSHDADSRTPRPPSPHG